MTASLSRKWLRCSIVKGAAWPRPAYQCRENAAYIARDENGAIDVFVCRECANGYLRLVEVTEEDVKRFGV